MYEELVRDLRNWSKAWGDEPNPIGPVPVRRLAAAADAIEELQGQIDGWIDQERKALIKSLPRWISVTERLPEDDRTVLVAFVLPGKKAETMVTISQRASWSEKRKNNPFYQSYVTHWMPLPTPPEDSMEWKMLNCCCCEPPKEET